MQLQKLNNWIKGQYATLNKYIIYSGGCFDFIDIPMPPYTFHTRNYFLPNKYVVNPNLGGPFRGLFWDGVKE